MGRELGWRAGEYMELIIIHDNEVCSFDEAHKIRTISWHSFWYFSEAKLCQGSSPRQKSSSKGLSKVSAESDNLMALSFSHVRVQSIVPCLPHHVWLSIGFLFHTPPTKSGSVDTLRFRGRRLDPHLTVPFLLPIQLQYCLLCLALIS